MSRIASGSSHWTKFKLKEWSQHSTTRHGSVDSLKNNYGFSIGEPISTPVLFPQLRLFESLSPPLFTGARGRGADQREVGMNSVGRPNGSVLWFLPHGSALWLQLILVKLPIKALKGQIRLCQYSQSSNLAALKPLCVVTLLLEPDVPCQLPHQASLQLSRLIPRFALEGLIIASSFVSYLVVWYHTALYPTFVGGI